MVNFQQAMELINYIISSNPPKKNRKGWGVGPGRATPLSGHPLQPRYKSMCWTVASPGAALDVGRWSSKKNRCFDGLQWDYFSGACYGIQIAMVYGRYKELVGSNWTNKNLTFYNVWGIHLMGCSIEQRCIFHQTSIGVTVLLCPNLLCWSESASYPQKQAQVFTTKFLPPRFRKQKKPGVGTRATGHPCYSTCFLPIQYIVGPAIDPIPHIRLDTTILLSLK